MNATTFGSVPRGVRDLAPIAALRLRPLPAPSKDELDRWRQYIRRRPIPNSKFPGGGSQPNADPLLGFPRGFNLAGDTAGGRGRGA